MNKEVSTALDAVDMTYAELIEISNDISVRVVSDTDSLIAQVRDNVENMTNDYIRDVMLKLALQSYSFSEIKEKSAFKAQVAKNIHENAYAQNFNQSEGSVAVRENLAVIQTSAEILAEEIYSLVASIFKTKLAEIHSTIDVLKTILMSRLSEAKLVNIDTK